MKFEEIENIREKLSKTPGIMNKELKYFNSAVLILLYNKKDELNFIFQQRKKNIRQGGEICFPGGKFDKEKDITYEDTAIRETIEEIGISKNKLKIIGGLDTVVAPMGATIDPFIGLAEISDLDELRINENEVEEIFSLPVSFFEKIEPERYNIRLTIQAKDVDDKGAEIIYLPSCELGLSEKYEKSWKGREYPIFVYKTDQGIIWGITAEIIYDFIKKLEINKKGA